MELPQLQPLAPDIMVGPQLTPDQMRQAAEMGFKSVINNRPDYEGGPLQPTSEQIQQAALGVGLTYAYLPVNGAYQTPEEIAKFAELLETLPRPILIFCRSGARSSKLFYAAMSA